MPVNAQCPVIMEQLIAANILIGDRTYRLKIKPDDEEGLRKTVKLINDKILEFKTNFAGKDMQDYISMVLLWLASEQPEHAVQMEDQQELAKKLSDMNTLIMKQLADD